MNTNSYGVEVTDRIREIGRDAEAAIARAAELWDSFVRAATNDADNTTTGEYLGDAVDEAGMDINRLTE